jgi:hypothetical protein
LIVFQKKPHALMAIQNEAILWLSTDAADMGRCLCQLPLESVLGQGGEQLSVPATLRGNNTFLCLIPDHWFGVESYPFKSTKPALIEPFLQRKLSSSHPGRHAIGHFFHYKSNPSDDGSDNLYAYFLQEEKAYQINSALIKLNLAPLGFTTPAFIWEEKLKAASPVFDQQGSLLVHMGQAECQLYFYFNGHYLFSRSVVLAEDQSDRIGAVAYEINQSLYLFSQKTKSELKQIYLLANGSSFKEALGEALGRELIDYGDLIPESRQDTTIPEVPFLEGLLTSDHRFWQRPIFSVIHRRIRRHLEWKPVQVAGIAVGLFLALLLIGEAFFLAGLQRSAESERRLLRNQMQDSAGTMLSGYEEAFTQVMQRIDRPSCADTVLLTMASLPANVWLKKLDIDVATRPVMKVTASVEARDMEHLRTSLAQLVTKINARFSSPQALTLNAIDVDPVPRIDGQVAPHFTIVFELDLG